MPEKLSASRAARLMSCSASANLPLAIPNWSEPTAEEQDARPVVSKGHALHATFAELAVLPAVDLKHMISAMQYVHSVRTTRKFKVLAEQSVMAEWLTVPVSTTADLVLYVQDEIHVFDLKTGKLPVEVVENEQLLYYGACYAPLAPLAKGVTLHIVQPWAEGNHSWFADTLRIKKFMDDARAAETKILAGDTTFGPSDHCKFCPANPHSRGLKGKPLCPAMMKLLYPAHLDEDEILSL